MGTQKTYFYQNREYTLTEMLADPAINIHRIHKSTAYRRLNRGLTPEQTFGEPREQTYRNEKIDDEDEPLSDEELWEGVPEEIIAAMESGNTNEFIKVVDQLNN